MALKLLSHRNKRRSRARNRGGLSQRGARKANKNSVIVEANSVGHGTAEREHRSACATAGMEFTRLPDSALSRGFVYVARRTLKAGAPTASRWKRDGIRGLPTCCRPEHSCAAHCRLKKRSSTTVAQEAKVTRIVHISM